MQESQPEASRDEGSAHKPSESAPRDGVGAPSARQVPSDPARAGDPVVRWLILGIGGIIILWLVGVLSAVLFGVITPPKAPRTSTERDLVVLSAQVQTGKVDARTLARYVETLIQAGQLGKAQSTIDQAMKTMKTGTSYIVAEQAQLLFATKDYAGTVTAADKAMAEAKKEVDALKAANLAANRKEFAGVTLPDSYLTAALAKAEALASSKQYTASVKAFDAYLAEQPIDSDILVRRAQVKVLLGDKTGAAKDFRAALKYVPDYQSALDGLKQIGASK